MSPEAPKHCSIVLSSINVRQAAFHVYVITYPWKELAPLSFELITIKLQHTLMLVLGHGRGIWKIKEGGNKERERILPYGPVYLDDHQYSIFHKGLRRAHCDGQNNQKDNSRGSSHRSELHYAKLDF